MLKLGAGALVFGAVVGFGVALGVGLGDEAEGDGDGDGDGDGEVDDTLGVGVDARSFFPEQAPRARTSTRAVTSERRIP